MRGLLKRGIGVHHSGILPIIKEVRREISHCWLLMFPTTWCAQVVELLFQRGLVKVSLCFLCHNSVILFYK